MAKFNYKFDTIKKVKQIVEKKVQKEVSVIELEIEKRKLEIKELEDEKFKTINEFKIKKSLKVSEIQFVNNFEKLIDEKIAAIKNEILGLEKSKQKKMEELTQKSKETKMFEKLEEKHLQQFIVEQNRLEQIEIDDIATKKTKGN
ncbi:MAG TPA: flagellar FliJ family protein [Melioribacteraceae bacterium]|nr:flagellar FliJ family protein [Melioribacteraceae bacterium]